MNKAILIGRLTKDPELKYTSSNKAVASFTLAVDKYPEGTDFINCVVWEKQAENLNKYCGKGKLIAVDGKISTRNYDDKDGKKVYVTEVIANNIQFLDSKNKEVGQASKEAKEETDPFQQMHDEIEQSGNIEFCGMAYTDDELPF